RPLEKSENNDAKGTPRQHQRLNRRKLQRIFRGLPRMGLYLVHINVHNPLPFPALIFVRFLGTIPLQLLPT
ncbi:MAG: hypothetical protein FWF80_04025, partial [Defluviitaleaceae bacterium]|nr:hypothetical protein [Defluviitaleaceae bacterium]